MLPKFSLYGGVEQFGWNLARVLAERGHHVDFICARQEAEAPKGVTPIIVGRCVGIRACKILQFTIGAERARRKGNYDLSVSLGKTWNQDMMRVGGGPLSSFWRLSEAAYPTTCARLFKRLKRLADPANWIIHCIEKRQYRKGNRIVCVSDSVRDWTLEAFPQLVTTPPDVIYNKPNLARFSPPTPEQREKARKTFAIEPHQRVISTATSNFALKGTYQLIEALSQLPNDVVLLIAGGRDATRYRKRAAYYGLADRVHFLGKVDDMPTLYHATDIFALPTFYDACSNAVLEALASGARTLSTTHNGSSYFLPKHWILNNPADVPALVELLRSMLEEAPPEAFDWPQELPSGIPAWIDYIEAMLENKKIT